jgi:hypothetical protein
MVSMQVGTGKNRMLLIGSLKLKSERIIPAVSGQTLWVEKSLGACQYVKSNENGTMVSSGSEVR